MMFKQYIFLKKMCKQPQQLTDLLFYFLRKQLTSEIIGKWLERDQLVILLPTGISMRFVPTRKSIVFI